MKRILYLKNSNFIKDFLYLAIPISLQYFINSSLSMIDTIMVGNLGDVAVASVGLAGHITFILIVLLFGINSGASIFMSQYWGKKDIISIRKILGISLILNIFTAFIFFIICMLIPEKIFGFFSKDITVIQTGSGFLRIICVEYIMLAIINTYAMALRCIKKIKFATTVSIMAVISNIREIWIP